MQASVVLVCEHCARAKKGAELDSISRHVGQRAEKVMCECGGVESSYLPELACRLCSICFIDDLDPERNM